MQDQNYQHQDWKNVVLTNPTKIAKNQPKEIVKKDWIFSCLKNRFNFCYFSSRTKCSRRKINSQASLLAPALALFLSVFDAVVTRSSF